MSGPLLIVGASGRAAAASAIRAGYSPFVIDLFTDADTRRLCPTFRCDPADYPHGFIPLAKQAPPGPWMYTGGLENYPDVVAAISECRELFGNGPEVLRKVRDPYELGKAIRATGGAFPETVPIGTQVLGEAWLCKSLISSGGGHVRFAKSSDFDTTSTNVRECLQRFVDGKPMSAQFRRDSTGIQILGLTRQLIGTSWLHATRFSYVGNIAVKNAKLEAEMVLHLQAYANDFGLSRCWGTDFMDLGSGKPWTIEVNPRYTAGMEVLEYATGRSALVETVAVARQRRTVGKAIYYAPHRIIFPASGPWDDSLSRCTDVWTRPDFADIPDAGSVMEAGQPVFTLFAEAETEEECEAKLRKRASEIDAMFGFSEVSK